MAPLVRTGGSRHTGLAALPHRNIHMGVKQGNFLLKVKNTFNPELIKFDNNGKRLRTSKTDKSNHGMGIGLIEETALKYNGLMEITMNENIFCLSVLLYQN